MEYHSTIGLLASHKNFNGKPKLVRVCFEKQDDEKTVMCWVESARTYSRMNTCGVITITREEFANSPDDPYDDAVFACWAFNLFNLKTAFVR